MPVYFAFFDTMIGRCGLAWGARGIAGVQLPEGTKQKSRARLLQRFPGAREALPSEDARFARDGIVALLRGEENNLSTVALDMEDVPPFHRRVYEAAQRIPLGETATYGMLAERIGAAGAARAVGQALSRNPFAIIVPCHRVVAAGRRIGGFSAHGGITAKLRLLAIEGTPRDSVPSPFDSSEYAQKSLRCG
ncbi:MAG: methylated-DNA--[protein]-cysteine S-methyltransferase [Beijerinckiaceae bacterium]|nr:methylated-DNA--[protein]-cysteine S-methyltransferase [Beijerinckiaceae bacterium]MCI0735667.1 methylated-DNA--[protein]-cysteine S-methyltransferase [Beijerinckiaceae bacterium]